ncbi:hypothetical protein N0B31_02590 [Salinirubellus salinus]|uniref:Uncharacterized protein n=1 Tax=Salinirubellus salinus TaxID=1364945 RepID=A0A9E7R5P5_9EURY|nr:hypothetical protein [Salinirubellus salinus]UWM55178.1 hypothetical protein N0B31_02590 [Salinirubellus salinus]
MQGGDSSRRARGQAHTLEALAGSLLLVGALVFALQVTAVTPLSASTSSQHIENQQQATAAGVLSAAVEEGTLRDAVLYWNDGSDPQRFHDAVGQRYYVDRAPPNGLGTLLDRAFASRAIVYNVYVHYEEDGRRKPQRMVYRGEPSDNAVSTSVTLTLYDDDVLRNDDGDPTTTSLSSADFYAPDAHAGGVYNVLEVEVVAWRQ